MAGVRFTHGVGSVGGLRITTSQGRTFGPYGTDLTGQQTGEINVQVTSNPFCFAILKYLHHEHSRCSSI